MAWTHRTGTGASAGVVASVTVTKPTGVGANELLVGGLSAQVAGKTTSGLTNEPEADGGVDHSGHASYKVTGGGEPADYTFTLSATDNNFSAALAAIYDPQGAVPAFRTSAVQNTASSVDQPAPAVTAVRRNSLLVCIWTVDNGAAQTFTVPGDMTEVVQQQSGIGAAVCIAYRVVQPGSTGTKTASISSAATGRAYSFLFEGGAGPLVNGGLVNAGPVNGGLVG